MARVESILETVGRTPVVRVRRLAPSHVRLYVKVEAFNPLGSVKDRLALGLIEDAERSGRLRPGQTVIEATSGNTGIGLAMVCAAKGYPLVVVMAENFSLERRKMMRFLGARVVLTPAWKKGTGMLAKARQLAEAHGWFLCRQFENEANADVHSRTTAQEILADFDGDRLDYWVTGAGTGGTLKGVGRVLRERRPETKIVVCEPDNSPMLGSGIRQPRGPDGSVTASHPLFRPHLVQGWTPDFIPKLTEDAFALGLVDRVEPIDSGDAMRLCRELAQQEGIFAGTSGGATLAGALKICQAAPEGTTVLCMLPDTGERYLSTPLFDGIATEMTAEELEMARSTGDRPEDAPSVVMGAPSPEGDEFVGLALADRERPVVMFAFEWCEFCWSVRKLFARCGIPFRSVDLDSVELQKDDLGGKIRAAIARRTGSVTIPQILIGGHFVGGATEVFDAFKEGRLQALLVENRVAFDQAVQVDPYTLLPNWLQARGEPAACAVPRRD
jgi:cysteine synthase A